LILKIVHRVSCFVIAAHAAKDPGKYSQAFWGEERIQEERGWRNL
jgi:hypothetical protein